MNDAQSHVPAPRNPAELALDIYKLLEGQPAETIQRAVQSALTSLGQGLLQTPVAGSPRVAAPVASADFDDVHLGPKAQKWVQRHGISRAMLDEVFHLTGSGVEITASNVPGASKKEMTINCYLLSGLRGLLASDVATLDEGEVIAVCKRLTAYDKNNHTTNRTAVGNKMSGTKPSFTLTGPGETAAAELLKAMTAEAAV